MFVYSNLKNTCSKITPALSSLRHIIPKFFLESLCHFIATLAVVGFMLFYVRDNLFGTYTRMVQATQADGSSISAGYRPSQSDITTIISFLAAITRLLGTRWASDLLWRCVFLFTMKGGISVRGTKRMFSMPLPARRDFKKATTFIWFCLVQFAVFSSNFYSPALTGSITWGPEILFIPSITPIDQIPQFGPGSSLENYFRYSSMITQVVATASARANLGWIGSESIAMKRVLPITSGVRHLPGHTRLDGVTVPYFKVESFDWIKDPNSTLTPNQLQIVSSTDDQFSPFFADSGRAGFIPDDRWGPLKKSNNSEPHQVLETRVLAVRGFRHNLTSKECNVESLDFGTIPPDVGHILLQFRENHDCMYFANVTYHACVALCRNCQISSWTVISSEGADLQLAPDRLVEEALAIVPYLSTHLLFTDYATPLFLTGAGNRSLELMSRSFQAAWMVLTDIFNDGEHSATSYAKLAVESAKADVDVRRVYIWCIFNFFLLLVGLLFRTVDVWSSGMWLDSPSFAAVLLNTGTPDEESHGGIVANPWEPVDLPDGFLTRDPNGRFLLTK